MKRHSGEHMRIWRLLLPTLLGAQGPGRRPSHSYVTCRSSCHAHRIWLTSQRKKQHPDNSWPALTTRRSPNLLLLLPQSHQHWIISTFGTQCQGFPPTHIQTHTHYEWNQHGDVWIELMSRGASHCVYYGSDDRIYIPNDAFMMSQDLTVV